MNADYLVFFLLLFWIRYACHHCCSNCRNSSVLGWFFIVVFCWRVFLSLNLCGVNYPFVWPVVAWYYSWNCYVLVSNNLKKIEIYVFLFFYSERFFVPITLLIDLEDRVWAGRWKTCVAVGYDCIFLVFSENVYPSLPQLPSPWLQFLDVWVVAGANSTNFNWVFPLPFYFCHQGTRLWLIFF